MKLLMLYGMNCTVSVWDNIKELLKEHEVTYVSYPHDVLQQACHVLDISNWVSQTYPGPYDAVIGHSMGGVIALQICAQYVNYTNNIMLLDTNLVPAKPFYRNVLMQCHEEAYQHDLSTMFQAEAAYYSSMIKKELQVQFNYCDLVRKCKAKLFGVYGDRGERGYKNRIHDLCLDEDVIAQITFCFIENTCHMPMLENPKGLANIIQACLIA